MFSRLSVFVFFLLFISACSNKTAVENAAVKSAIVKKDVKEAIAPAAPAVVSPSPAPVKAAPM